jgi:hypothetical protein
MHATPTTRRLTYAGLTALLLGALIVRAIDQGGGYWLIAAFAVGPDLALRLGMGRGLEKGQLHPRAVGLYNLVHRFWGPLTLGALAALSVLPPGLVLGALAWALHVALDRAVGYTLRRPDGFQRC